MEYQSGLERSYSTDLPSKIFYSPHQLCSTVCISERTKENGSIVEKQPKPILRVSVTYLKVVPILMTFYGEFSLHYSTISKSVDSLCT